MDMNDVQQWAGYLRDGGSAFSAAAKGVTSIRQGIDGLRSLTSSAEPESDHLEAEFEELAAKVEQLQSDLGDKTPTEAFPAVKPVASEETEPGRADGDAASQEWVRAQLLAVLGCVQKTLEGVRQLNEIAQNNVESMSQLAKVESGLNQVVEAHNELLRSHNETLQVLIRIAGEDPGPDRS